MSRSVPCVAISANARSAFNAIEAHDAVIRVALPPHVATSLSLAARIAPLHIGGEPFASYRQQLRQSTDRIAPLRQSEIDAAEIQNNGTPRNAKLSK